MPKVVMVWNRKELEALQPAIIVECWTKCMGSMKFKRNYKIEFTEKERKYISKLHTLFYDWTMRKGIPDSKIFSLPSYNLAIRATNFFAANCP